MTGPRKGNGSSSDADAPSGRHSRRHAIALAGAGAAAATVAALGLEHDRKAHAASGDPLKIGQANEANPGDSTRLRADVDNPAFLVLNENTGDHASGVAGASLGGGAAVDGFSNWGIGVKARGSSGVGVHGDTFDGIGVRAQCLGAADPEHPMGPELALDVIGKARFSTAGSGIVPAWANRATVDNEAVTGHSHVTVTFTRDPGRASVAWVQRQPGSGFVVHLSARPHWDVPFTYLIVEANT